MAMFLSAGSRINEPVPPIDYKVINLGYDYNSRTINMESYSSFYNTFTNDNFLIDIAQVSKPRSNSFRGNITFDMWFYTPKLNFNWSQSANLIVTQSAIGVYPTYRQSSYLYETIYLLRPITIGETPDLIQKIGTKTDTTTGTLQIDVSSVYSDYSSLVSSNFIVSVPKNYNKSKQESRYYYSTTAVTETYGYNRSVSYNASTGILNVNIYAFEGITTDLIYDYPDYDIYLYIPSE